MNVREVFCDYCYRWKKREDLVEALNRGGELYCEECGAVLIRTDEYNPKKESTQSESKALTTDSTG